MPTKKADELQQVLLAYLGDAKVSPHGMFLELLPFVPRGLLTKAARISYRMLDPAARRRAQLALRLRLGDEDLAIRLATAIRQGASPKHQPRERARMLVELAGLIAGEWPDRLVHEARNLVAGLDDATLRAQALQALLPHLPEYGKQTAIKEIEAVVSSADYPLAIQQLSSEGYGDLAILADFTAIKADVARSIEGMSDADQLPVFEAALERIDAKLEPEPANFQLHLRRLESIRKRAPTQLLPPSRRVVNTGFAPARIPDEGFEPTTFLLPGVQYLYWLEIGEQLAHSIEAQPTAIPAELLPSEARLQVVLFGFDKELELNAAADLGEIRLTPEGRAIVTRQPLQKSPDLPISDALDRRLFFPVRTPNAEGDFRLRCNIYYKHVLVQSRVVSALVAKSSGETVVALRSVVDYTLTESLRPADFAGLRPHRFSLMINDNDSTSHSFRFFGTNGEMTLKKDLSMTDAKVKSWVTDGRGRLRRASWNDIAEWSAGKQFQYDGARTPVAKLDQAPRAALLKRLTTDLARLAVTGYRLYRSLSVGLGTFDSKQLEDIVRTSGPVQIALRLSSRLVIPAALIYDYHWDTEAFDLSTAKYELCPTFSKALLADASLEECECFKGKCPVMIEGDRLRADTSAILTDLGAQICPSGFWGYRHALGLPLTITDSAADTPSGQPPADAPPFILFQTTPEILSGISTDLKLFPTHQSELKKLAPGATWKGATQTRSAVLRMLKGSHAQIIYFYCHGGVLPNGHPFLSVGELQEPVITPDNIDARWPDSHPLVFVNGCHTTALDPETALDFVSTFITAKAAGVVGTEITISEALAGSFAEQCFSRFLTATDGRSQSQTLGDAVRGARLALLKMGNPLGLVYIPFAVESLRLHKAA